MSSNFSVCLTNPAEIRRVFSEYDTNKDGRISITELTSILATLTSSTPSKSDVQLMMGEIDTDKDGFISLEEFTDFHQTVSKGDGDKDLKVAFELYDKNKNGLISARELRDVLKSLGQKVTVGDCEGMIKSVDDDGDGNVNFVEFKRMMRSGNGFSNGKGN